MVIFLIALWLGGCSVVIFEDSTTCPAEMACPISTPDIALSTGKLETTESGDTLAPVEFDTPSSMTVSPETASSQATTVRLVDAEPTIDGYLNYFDYDSAELRKSEIGGLLFVAEYLKANPMTRVLVEGHCDERGTRDYNLALGEKRAEAVRVRLTKMRVDRSRIKTRSFGKERPAVLGTSSGSWAKNRRTVIRLIPE